MKENEIDTFDVTGTCFSDELRYIAVSYKGKQHTIPLDKLWRVLGCEYDERIDEWFNDAKNVDRVFGGERGLYMTVAINALIRVLEHSAADLPIEGIDLGVIKHIADTSGDYETYFRSIIAKGGAGQI